MEMGLSRGGQGSWREPPGVTEGLGGVCPLSSCLGRVFRTEVRRAGGGSCSEREMWSRSLPFSGANLYCVLTKGRAVEEDRKAQGCTALPGSPRKRTRFSSVGGT